jgi:N-acetylmuramoyl-L-alanine amidase
MLRLARVAAALLSLGAATGAAGAEERPATACHRGDFHVTIDVGHSVDATGALSARGVSEYEFNLRLARRIEAELRSAGFSSTFLMISRGRGRAALVHRAERANRAPADLLLSVHHDSVQDSFLEPWTWKGRKLTFSDRYRGYSLFVSYDSIRREDSLRFATFLGDALKAAGMTFTVHHAEDIAGERRELIDQARGIYRYDELVVLRLARVPAVLLEAGVIVNRGEELMLASPEHQQRLSAAIVAAVERFCVAQRTR